MHTLPFLWIFLFQQKKFFLQLIIALQRQHDGVLAIAALDDQSFPLVMGLVGVQGKFFQKIGG